MVRSDGFSLLELLLGLAVAAAVGGSAALQLPPVVATIRLTGTAYRLASALRQARGHALEHNVRIDVRFDATANGWEVSEVGGRPLLRERLPPGVVFQSLPASRRVRFSTTGTADNATVVFAAGTRMRRVVVNQRGRVRVV